jgi:ADP-heptose:LPS heptosyltransferase
LRNWPGASPRSRSSTASDRDTAATYFSAPFAWPAHARDFTGVLSLRDTAALISQCSAMVANDSGLMHLAVALGVPTVGVHSDRGGFHPERTHDLSLYAQHYAHFVTYRPERLQRLRPEALSWLRTAADRFAGWRGFYERRPSLDGLWGRMSTAQGRNILDNLGFLSALPLDRHSPVLISPDPAALDGAAALLAPSHDPRFEAGYVTVHDGFDNTSRIAPGQATKCWPIESWTRMVAALRAARPDLAIVQLGAAKSRPIPGVHVGLLGRTSLAQTAWILARRCTSTPTPASCIWPAPCTPGRSPCSVPPTAASTAMTTTSTCAPATASIAGGRRPTGCRAVHAACRRRPAWPRSPLRRWWTRP